MNHDHAHCADFTEKCPKKCFRAQLVRDLQKYGKLAPYAINFPISWQHFEGTKECRKKGKSNDRTEVLRNMRELRPR